MNTKEINNATIEAIYWWNRDEHYYHLYFSNLDVIYKDKKLLAFFITKIFEVFLREYSIRRNLNAGHQSVDRFVDELFYYDFVQNVKDGNTVIVDIVSEKLKESQLSTKRNTRSLLSKIAFLVNPNKFVLYDSFW